MRGETQRSKWLRHLKNFPLGLWLGASLALVLAWAIDGDVAEHLAKNWTYLFSAMASLLAAALALSGVFSNIENQNRQAERNRLADLGAARAVLPLALSNLYQVALHGIDYALEDEAFYRDPSNLEVVRARLALDASILAALRDCIRHADEGSAEWLSAIIRKYQISLSRHEHYLTTQSLFIQEGNRAELGASWNLLRVMVDHCFDFGRGGSNIPEGIESTRLHMHAGSKFLGHRIYIEASNNMDLWKGTGATCRVCDLED